MNILSNGTLDNYAVLLAVFLIGYLLGNISPAYLFGRWFGKLDIRECGSGNAGTTNVIRVMGWKYGVPVFILDAGKGLAAAAIGLALGGMWGATAGAIGVVVGHDLPVFLNFRGGKGIASTSGIFFFLFPVPAMIGLLCFFLLVLATRMVSAGSLVFAISFFLFTILSGQAVAWLILSSSLALFSIIRHVENIRRILEGRENKISFGSR
jgi:acyl phosphate:glycerol-3-phosphate acyltransferase